MLTGRFRKKPQLYLANCDAELDGLSTLSPTVRDNKKPVFKKGRQVVIVAGSCSPSSGDLLAGYAGIIKEAFAGFDGTICSGGNNAGISGLIGSLTNLGEQAVRLGYLPKGERCMNGYACISTLPGEFSGYEPIMMWSDILVSDITPNSVRIVRVGGGAVARLEYQLALLLGAQVGLFADSGGACSKMLKDQDLLSAAAVPIHSRNPKYQLLSLLADSETLRAFIHPTLPSKLIGRGDREAIAKGLHDKYTALMKEGVAARLQNLADWEDLDDTFREANLSFVDHIDQKLQRIGLTLRKIPSKTPPVEHDPRIAAKIEQNKHLLAKMEHGRWVIDRLEGGWGIGERDDHGRTRPQLIPWDDLSSKEMAKDFKAIEGLPEILANEGYAIVKL